MTVLKKLWNFLLSIERFILIVADLGIVFLIFASVISRYILKINLGGLEELVVMVAFWVYFIGGAYGSYEESHISADIFSVFIKKRTTKAIMNIVRSFCTAVLFTIAAVFSMGLLTYALENGATSSVLKIPMTIVYSPIMIGLWLMAFYSVVHFLRYIYLLNHPEKEEAK